MVVSIGWVIVLCLASLAVGFGIASALSASGYGERHMELLEARAEAERWRKRALSRSPQ